MMKISTWTATAIFVVLIFYLLYIGQALLLPLVIAITLWYLINTLAAGFARLRLRRWRLPKPLCLVASLLTFLLALMAVTDFLSSSVDEVLQVAPEYQRNLTTRLENLPFVNMSRLEGLSPGELLTDWIDIPAYLGSFASSLTGVLASGGLILIYILFLFLEQGQFTSKIATLAANPRKEEQVNEIIRRIRDDIRKYISIKVSTSAATGILSYAFLRIIDVDFAGVWGLLIFLLNFIPTVGSIIATLFPAMIALAQSDGYLFLQVLAGIGALQMCIGNIIEPRLMGSSFNLSPIVILLNLALWGYIWGIPGMFLCVPLLIIITIIMSHFPQTRPVAVILSRDGRLSVPAAVSGGPLLPDPDAAALADRSERTDERG